MDDAKKIVTELLAKLAELENKVVNYQQDINAEFERYSTLLLQDVPEHVSSEVSRVIAESMPNFPMLNAPRCNHLESPTTLTGRGVWDGRKSPPPILYHTSGTPKDGPRSPHEREKEFQGVFTPSYLPLLESGDRSQQSPPTSPLPAASPGFIPPVGGILTVDEILELRSSEDTARPTPSRRQTDGTVSSVESSGSDAKARRSALRRTSSSTKGSPRRVRFEVQGIEVLPTSSPQATDEPSVCLGGAEVPTSAIVDDSPVYAGPSLLDVEGEEDSLPRPKKVSSTQALRALTRNAPDEGTVWTVVNPDLRETPKTNGLSEAVSPKPSPATPTAATMTTASSSSSPLKTRTQSPSHKKIVIAEQPQKTGSQDKPRTDAFDSDKIERENADDKDSSEEEFLSIRSKTLKKSTPPPAGSRLLGSRVSQGAAGDKASTEDTEEAFFSFDGDDTISGMHQQPHKTEKYLPEEREAQEDDEQEVERAGKRNEVVPQPPVASYSTLPKMSIPKASPDTRTITPAAARFLQGSVGSYKGQSLRMSAVVNPQVQEQAAALGDFSSLVGSIHDLNDFEVVNSFRTSLTNTVAATPRSFSERMAIEEAMEKEREQ